MPAFLVRYINGRQAAGLFVAEDLLELQDVIDEFTDPAECEYFEIEFPGGLAWGDGAAVLPLVHPNEWMDEARGALEVVGSHTLSEAWFYALTDEGAVFKRVVPPRDIPANDF